MIGENGTYNSRQSYFSSVSQSLHKRLGISPPTTSSGKDLILLSLVGYFHSYLS